MIDRNTIVFDFDGTIVAVNSFQTFYRRFLEQRPLRALASLAIGCVLWPWLLLPPTREFALTLGLWSTSLGINAERWRQSIEAFAADLSATQVYPQSLHHIRHHLSQGQRVLIVTGSATDLVTAVCHQLGLEEVEVIGSHINTRWGGQWLLKRCLGESKVLRLVDEHNIREFHRLYTDSIMDLPLMRRAETTVLINSTLREQCRVEQALSDRVLEAHWLLDDRT